MVRRSISKAACLLGSCGLLFFAAWGHAAPKCYPASEASRHLHKSVCVQAHIYSEVDLDDGTRILDLCGPSSPAGSCSFALVSLGGDRTSVGDLHPYIGHDVRVRGTVEPIRDRAEILISDAGQFHGKPGKFRPNPELLKNFNAQQNRLPVNDPAFHRASSHTGSSQ